ncbi:hypothetical protein [Fluviicola taffensis]|uniref:hypothetical protein n=1 Tax=Fluviicola taffensis TaxID=191579 RepID=UPI0031379D9F
MKSIYYLLIVLISCSCSGEPKEVQTKEKTEKPTSEIRNEKISSKPEELQIHSTKYCIVPIDETSEDESLQAFVSKLKGIVKRKDLAGLLNCLDTGIVVSWGGGMHGVETFLEEWKLNKQPKKSPLWVKMKHLLELGGAWEDDKKEFRFPYAQCDRFFQNMEFDFDWYVTAVCISSKTNVYQRPLPNAEKTALLSYEVVQILDRGADFIKIQTIDKKVTGFVKKEQLVLSADSYPILEKTNGEWKIVSFAPYD